MYANCSNCGASNRATDSQCYSCKQSMAAGPPATPSGEAVGGAYFSNPSNRVVVTQGPAALPEYSAQGLRRLPLVMGIVLLVMLWIGAPAFGPMILLMAIPFLLIGGLCAYMLQATGETEKRLRQGRVVPARVLSGEIQSGGRNSVNRMVVRFAFEGDQGPLQGEDWRSMGNFSDNFAKPPAPETPCYVLYRDDRCYRLL